MARKEVPDSQPNAMQSALIDPSHAPHLPSKASRRGAVVFSLVLGAVVFAAVLALGFFALGRLTVVSIGIAAVAAVLAPMSAHVTMEWERLVITRWGAYSRTAGPGLVFMVPVVEQVASRVDLRTMATPFGAEKTLTSDLVPLDVDAVLYWMVWDARKASLEVEAYCAAVLYVAQTTLRDAIGRASVAEVAISRDQLDKELIDAIRRETEPWGVAVLSVKVRDIVLPGELQDAMSLEAQAERERNARIILADAEGEISEMIQAAGKAYDGNDAALKIRTLHLLYESIRKSGSTVITVPSSMSDGFVPGVPQGPKAP